MVEIFKFRAIFFNAYERNFARENGEYLIQTLVIEF